MTTEKNTILVVDDEEAMREMLALMLAREGYQVQVEASGEAALNALLEKPFKLMLCDVRMPGMDGLTLLSEIRKQNLSVSTIMMSAFVDHDTAVEALKLGALDYISKPFKRDEVILKIRLAEERVRLTEERARLAAENEQLKQPLSMLEIAQRHFVGESQKVQQLLNFIVKIAPYKSTVLVTGESGTGKEIVAQLLHRLSGRNKGPFVPINCGAIPENLLESELFGYCKGAFTDARKDKRGLIEEADGGTLFLDEIAELTPALQVKLLRFLQEEEIRRVGDNKDIKVDVRVVAATAVDLPKAVADGRFREDLFYRLNVLPVSIPPLRERTSDIPVLAAHFIGLNNDRYHRQLDSFSPEAMELMQNYSWPGNVRELENCVERAVVLSDEEIIGVENLPEKLWSLKNNIIENITTYNNDSLSIKEATAKLEADLIRRALEQTGGNRTQAAKLLEISHRALLYKLHDYKIN